MCGYLGNAAFRHAELDSASRSKNRWTLKNQNPLNAVKTTLSVNGPPPSAKKKTKIPKQVRDDNRGDFQKVIMCMTALADSENAIIRHELVSASRSKNRCTL